MTGKNIMRSLSALCWAVSLFAAEFGVHDAEAQGFTRRQFRYEQMGTTPAEDCDTSQNDTLDLAMRLVDRFQSKQAVEIAKQVFSVAPKCPRAQSVYALCLFRSGEWLKAIEIIDHAIEALGSYPDVIKVRAYMAMEMGSLGTKQKVVDGNSLYSKGLPFDEEQFKKENYKTALNDLLFLVKDHPEKHDETYRVAYLCFMLGQYNESNRFLEKLLTVKQYRDNALMGLTNNYIATEQYGLAEKMLLEMESANPRALPIHQQFVKLYTVKGDTAKAEERQKKLQFYRSVPSFTSLDFSEENSELVAFFGSIQNKPKDKFKKLDTIIKKRDKNFVIDVCLTILAVHQNHDNGLEAKAVQELIRFGQDSVPKVIQLLALERVSTCALTNAADILATVKDERGWQPLVDSLYRMTRLPSTLIPPAIPDKMMKFDRDRSINVLLPFIRDMIRADQEGDDSKDPGDSFGRSMLYFNFCSPFASMGKAALRKLAKQHAYTEKETEILIKYASDK